MFFSFCFPMSGGQNTLLRVFLYFFALFWVFVWPFFGKNAKTTPFYAFFVFFCPFLGCFFSIFLEKCKKNYLFTRFFVFVCPFLGFFWPFFCIVAKKYLFTLFFCFWFRSFNRNRGRFFGSLSFFHPPKCEHSH